ncbi:PREDICTED: semaphorin-4G-like [Tinamus guttatus]|uniref:semaphorin-4G-like n=1 Tax=Tinamus guttatus TaxID=94827 RepID=UPI00052E7D7B|nr:PREDICTED: semaphorin-4G-like [Tinamus guttatus]
MGYPSQRSATDLDATPRTTITFEGRGEGLSTVERLRGGLQPLKLQPLEPVRLPRVEGLESMCPEPRGWGMALPPCGVSPTARTSKIHWEASPEKRLDCLQKGKNNQPLSPQDADRFTLPSHFEEGKEKCPYDPSRGYTGLIVDGGLYTATRYEFRSLPDIRRNLHQRPLKTEESPLHWLNDAEFVASVLVRESQDSPVGDDDKIYYFFTERAGEETTSFFDKSQAARVARVARVCKSDLGGKKILQRKWTSFMKARLVCYIPYYEVLRSVCSLDGGAWPSTVFYAAFTLSAQWRTMEGPLASPLGSASFAEELSRMLEKRKHTQLVEKLDESSV